MKINKLRYKVYGKLIDHDIELSPGINIFLGDNEAGKSTIFNSIATLIYGFKPTSRDKHPYVNWSRNEINFSSEIVVSGELFTVERSLKSMPRLNISRAITNTAQLSQNEPLPFASHVSDALFKAVFYLTSEDLNQFERTSFESIQEKLIFNYGTDYLNKASDVILQLEQDINALWRRDKRGNPKINQLQNEINHLKLQRHDAEKNYASVQAAILRIDEIDTALDCAVSDKKNLAQTIRQLRSSLPIRELIERIEALKCSIYNMEAFKSLDVTLIDKIEQNHIKLFEAEAKVQKKHFEQTKIKEALCNYSEHDKKILDFRVEIEPLKNGLSDLIRLEHEEHSKLDELMKLREKMSGQFKILFDSEIGDIVRLDLKKLPVLDLMTLVQKYIEGFELNTQVDKRALSNRSQVKKRAVAMGILGITVSVLGFVYEPLRILSFVGFGLIGFSIAHIKTTGTDIDSETVDLNALKLKIDAACLSIRLPEYVYRDNNLRFFGKLEQLILLLHEEDALHERWLSLIERQNTIEETISNLMQSKGFDTSRGAVLSLQYVLAQMDHLTEIVASEAKKLDAIDMIEASIASEMDEIKALEDITHNLKSQIENFGDGDYDFGLKMFAQNVELTRKIKVFNDELSQKDYALDVVIKASDQQLLDFESQISEIDALEKTLLSEKSKLMSEIHQLNEKVNFETINSQILVAEAQLEDLMEHRNHLMVLLEIIKFSDERYRIENQPNIITQVSRFMSQMTQGKYQEVLISEDNGRFDLQFLIEGELVSIAKAFSKGTIQQLFFAYRLAVLEALDPDNALPFVLDEVFVNWDSKRFTETLKLLEEVANERQIFVFTCHQTLAMQIAENTKSKLIEVTV